MCSSSSSWCSHPVNSSGGGAPAASAKKEAAEEDHDQVRDHVQFVVQLDFRRLPTTPLGTEVNLSGLRGALKKRDAGKVVDRGQDGINAKRAGDKIGTREMGIVNPLRGIS